MPGFLPQHLLAKYVCFVVHVLFALCFESVAPFCFEVAFLFITIVASSKNLNHNCKITCNNANMYGVKQLTFSQGDIWEKKEKEGKLRKA